MLINDLISQKKVLSQITNPVYGVGVWAFNRLGLENIIPNYKLLTLRHSDDTELIAQDIAVFSLEKGMGTKHIREPRNSSTIICHQKLNLKSWWTTRPR